MVFLGKEAVIDGGLVGGQIGADWEAPMLTSIPHQCFRKPPDVPIPQHFANLPNGKIENNDFAHRLLLVHPP